MSIEDVCVACGTLMAAPRRVDTHPTAPQNASATPVESPSKPKCLILVFWAQAACLAAVQNSSALANARSERADSSVHALLCMCVLLRSCKAGQKAMGECCPF